MTGYSATCIVDDIVVKKTLKIDKKSGKKRVYRGKNEMIRFIIIFITYLELGAVGKPQERA